MIGRGIAAPHMGEVVDWQSFFSFQRLFGQAHSRRQAPESHILYINRRGFGQECTFSESHRYILSHGEVIPEIPHFRDVNKDFQLKRLQAYLGKAEIYHNA
jgi:hypothetical protein